MSTEYQSVAGYGVVVIGNSKEYDEDLYDLYDLVESFCDKNNFSSYRIGNSFSGDIDHVILLTDFRPFDGEWNKKESERLIKLLKEDGFSHEDPKMISEILVY